jgi:endonuclease/exonuclease/phosphatase family metal-dependent hydrolase
VRSDFKLLAGSHPELEHWHGNVGDAVALDLAGPLVRGVTGLDVICWNVGIGSGRLEEVVRRWKAGELDGEIRPANRPLVILAQEAFRADNTVPEQPRTSHHGGKSPGRQRIDIVEAAHALGMSLRYAPSMRNGKHRSDRGNAILSSVEIAHARSFALPHVRQRRIAVAAELQGLPWLTLVSAHLDTRGRLHGRRATLGYAAGRTAQATELGRRLEEEWGTDQTVVIGADLNSFLGTREPLMLELAGKGFRRVAHEGRSRHTFHALPLRMLLDHVLIKTASDSIAGVRVIRLDESRADRERYIFGSDHHPLLARIEFASINRRINRK